MASFAERATSLEQTQRVEYRFRAAQTGVPLLRGLSRPAVEGLDAIPQPQTFRNGGVLFLEDQVPGGIFVICGGRVKLSVTPVAGRPLAIRLAGQGDVVGLPATMSGRPHEVTAQALGHVRANFISRQNFLEFVHEHNEMPAWIAKILCRIYAGTCRGVRS